MKEQEDILDTLITALTKRQNEQKQSNGTLPAVYHDTNSLPNTRPKGFWARLLDPYATITADFEKKQHILMLEARFKALEYEANGYAETIRIDQEHKVRLHEHEVRQKEAVMQQYAEARAQILKHNLQHGLMSQIADMNLDPAEEEYLIKTIVGICMRSEKEKRNDTK